MRAYEKLKASFKQQAHLLAVQRILHWDEAVMMPEGAGSARAEAVASFNCLMQKLLVSKKNQKLLQAAQQEGQLSAWDQANLAWMEKKIKLAACVPPRLTEKFTKETMACEQAWRKLRAENNWRGFLPLFRKLFKLTQEIAQRRGDALGLKPYDAMLDEFAPGFNKSSIDAIFSELKKTIPDLMQKIIKKQATEKIELPQGPFPIHQQEELGRKIMSAMGFDFQQGRLDVSHHPFCGGNPTDVRITTRYTEKEFFSALGGVCHETGHGLYEQGLPREWLDQPVGEVNSMAMHESQSLLMESLVCCSKAFYEFLTPKLRQSFGSQPAFEADNLYRLATRVKPGLIRVESDEVTYQLHIILRYELEKRLFQGELKLEDLPAAWNELMQSYLGLSTEKDYRNGVMQDVHWTAAAFGYFPAYSLGRLIGAQLFAKFLEEKPGFFGELREGRFKTLTEWLGEKVYSQGAALGAEELLLKATGKKLESGYFLRHVEKRYLGE